MKKIEIFDSTLRDGAQSEGVSFSVQDKLNIIKTLDEFGVKYLEAGNPGSNPKDIEFFERAAKTKLRNAVLCAFGSTRRKNLKVEEDCNVLSLFKADTPAVAIFGKSWDLHITNILKATLDENLELVYDTLKFFKNKGKEVIFDAEHFYDGYKANPEYAIKVLEAAVAAEADALCLCDTNGGCFPDEIYSITREVAQRFPDMKLGIHCHNDTGCAVANSMVAVEGEQAKCRAPLSG